MNNVCLVGNLTRDVELKFSKSDTAYFKFTVAANGFKKGDVDFVNCTVFGKIAEAVAQYCSKGTKVGVVGRLTTNEYEKDGIKVKTLEVLAEKIELLGGGIKKENNNSDDVLDDEFPF